MYSDGVYEKKTVTVKDFCTLQNNYLRAVEANEKLQLTIQDYKIKNLELSGSVKSLSSKLITKEEIIRSCQSTDYHKKLNILSSTLNEKEEKIKQLMFQLSKKDAEISTKATEVTVFKNQIARLCDEINLCKLKISQLGKKSLENSSPKVKKAPRVESTEIINIAEKFFSENKKALASLESLSSEVQQQKQKVAKLTAILAGRQEITLEEQKSIQAIMNPEKQHSQHEMTLRDRGTKRMATPQTSPPAKRVKIEPITTETKPQNLSKIKEKGSELHFIATDFITTEYDETILDLGYIQNIDDWLDQI